MRLLTNIGIYFLLMKIAAGLFGVGGPLLGWAMTRKKGVW